MIGTIHQSLMQVGNVAQQIRLERDHFSVPAFSEAGDLVRLHQVVKGEDLFKAKHMDLTVAGGR